MRCGVVRCSVGGWEGGIHDGAKRKVGAAARGKYVTKLIKYSPTATCSEEDLLVLLREYLDGNRKKSWLLEAGARGGAAQS